MAVEPDLHCEVYREFDVRVVDNEERYFCLLPPCADKNKSLSNRQHWITHRKFVHKEKDNINLPSGRVIRKWLTERVGYQPLGHVTSSEDRPLLTAPSEEGNSRTYNLVLQISGLMTQLEKAWQELARAVQDTNQSVPQAIPQIVAEKIKELYLNFERGAPMGDHEMPKKFEEYKGRKRRRKREDKEGEDDIEEWDAMEKGLAAGILPKQLKPLDIREGQQMYHPSPLDPEHSMEEGVVEDGNEMHAMEARIGEVGWELAPVNQQLQSDRVVLTDVDEGDPRMDGSSI